MKRIFVLIGISAFLVLSCATSVGIVFDDSLPVERSSQIYITNIGSVSAYNGIAVDWKKLGLKTVQIPAGETELLWGEISTLHGGTTYKGKDMLWGCSLKPNKKYYFSLAFKDNVPGLNVHEYEAEEKMSGTKSDLAVHFIDYRHFLNVRGPGEKAVLE